MSENAGAGDIELDEVTVAGLNVLNLLVEICKQLTL